MKGQLSVKRVEKLKEPGRYGDGHGLYPDEANRLSVSRAIAVETPRGWRIAKEKASHKIDFVVALAMAAHAAVQQPKSTYDMMAWPVEDEIDWNTMRRNAYVASGGWWR